MERLRPCEAFADPARSPGGVASLALRRISTRLRWFSGFTLVEVMLTVTIAGVLLAIALPMYQGYRDRIKVSQAAGDVMVVSASITEFKSQVDRFPVDLAEIAKDTMRDPWGNAYNYVNHADATGKGSFRKDKNIVPINSDFDLWSNGKDGASAPALTAKPSRDDVIRANDGGFVGLVSVYDP